MYLIVHVYEGSEAYPKPFELWADTLDMIVKLAEACHVQHVIAALRADDVSSFLAPYKRQTCHKLSG